MNPGGHFRRWIHCRLDTRLEWSEQAKSCCYYAFRKHDPASITCEHRIYLTSNSRDWLAAMRIRTSLSLSFGLTATAYKYLAYPHNTFPLTTQRDKELWAPPDSQIFKKPTAAGFHSTFRHHVSIRCVTMTPCHVVVGYRRFRGPCCLHLYTP
jgi:hypothetical protein